MFSIGEYQLSAGADGCGRDRTQVYWLARLILKPLSTRSICCSSGRWGLKMKQRNKYQGKSVRA